MQIYNVHLLVRSLYIFPAFRISQINISRCIADNWPWLMLYAMLNFDEVHYTNI